MAHSLSLFIDGACRGNPGPAAIGVLVIEKGKVIKEISLAIGDATNNIAEYTALIFGLQEALILRADSVKIHTDSELMFNQVSGNYKIKNSTLKFLNLQVKHLCEGFKDFEIKQIPREENKKADELATKAFSKEQTKVIAPMFDFGEESPSSVG